MLERSVFSYYVAALGRVLRRRTQTLGFALAAALHAFGHALVALVAGGVAISLAGGGASARPLSGLLFGAGRLADRALALSLVGLATIFVKAAAGTYATYVQSSIAGGVAAALRLDLLDALLAIHRLRQPRHGDHGVQVAPTASGVAALTDRVREVEAGLGHGLLGGARAVAQLVPLAALLVALSPRMAVAAAALQGGFGWLLGRVRSGYRRALKRAADDRARLLEAADESVRHADLWVTYGAEAKAREVMRALGVSIARGSALLDARVSALSGANEVLGAGALVFAVAACRAGWLGGATDGATLLAFAVAFFLAYRPVRELADARLAVARAELAYDELRQVTEGVRMAEHARPAPPPEPAEPRGWPLAALDVRSLRLAHGACADVSLRVAPGAIAVITGPTGVGKTTLAPHAARPRAGAGRRGHLRRHPPRTGARRPAGAPLRVGAAGRAPARGHARCERGSRGCARCPRRRRIDRARAAGRCPSRSGARVASPRRGRTGRVGRRAAVDRARPRDRHEQPVLLLDEPTSGLDPRSERAVLDGIARLRGRRTVIIVTHRREPLSIADVVLRLEPAGVEERAA